MDGYLDTLCQIIETSLLTKIINCYRFHPKGTAFRPIFKPRHLFKILICIFCVLV